MLRENLFTMLETLYDSGVDEIKNFNIDEESVKVTCIKNGTESEVVINVAESFCPENYDPKVWICANCEYKVDCVNNPH